MRLPLVAAAPRAQGSPAQLVAAWLTDAVGASLMVILGTATTAPIPPPPTGRTQAKLCSHPAVVEHPPRRTALSFAAGLAGRMAQFTLGSGVGRGRGELLIWAGNLFLLGASLDELHMHMDEV